MTATVAGHQQKSTTPPGVLVGNTESPDNRDVWKENVSDDNPNYKLG